MNAAQPLSIDLLAPPARLAPPQAEAVCRSRAAEARRFALAVDGPRERAIWMDVAELWDAAAASSSPFVRDRASQLHAAAFARLQ